MSKTMKSICNHLLMFVLAIGFAIPVAQIEYKSQENYSFAFDLTGQAEAAALSNSEENATIDWYLRAQTKTPPATIYIALETAAGSDTGCGTEVSTSNWTTYARVSVTSSLANWAGTQAAASTAASSGTGGTTSNNNAITFPTPQTSGGSAVTVTGFCAMSASTGGTMLFRATLTGSKTVNTNDPAPAFSPASLTYRIDD